MSGVESPIAVAAGVTADTTTETYDLVPAYKQNLILISDVSALGNGKSFVTSAPITLPVVIDATHDQFNWNAGEYTIAHASYATLPLLAAAVQAAANDEDNAGDTFVTDVVVSVDPNGTSLRFTSVPTGVHAEVFLVGAENSCLTRLGLTTTWTIAHTQAAGTDGAASQTVSILGVDDVSGNTWTILAAAAQTTVSTKVLQVGPTLTAAANLTANALLPKKVRVSVTHTTNNAVTRTLTAQFS